VINTLLGNPEARARAEAAAHAHAMARFAPAIAHADLFNLLESRLFY
jgi:hypothetical protein